MASQVQQECASGFAWSSSNFAQVDRSIRHEIRAQRLHAGPEIGLVVLAGIDPTLAPPMNPGYAPHVCSKVAVLGAYRHAQIARSGSIPFASERRLNFFFKS